MPRVWKLFLTLVLSISALSIPAFAGEIFSLGGTVGTPLTDVTQTTTIAGVNYLRNSTLFTIGPSLRINLPAGMRIEIEALYRPVAYQIAVGSLVSNVSASQFNFPILLQSHFGHIPLVKPYAEAGLSFDHLANLSQAASLLPTQPGAIVHTTDAGLVLGGGIDIKVPFLTISPEIRYTRQLASDFLQISNLNQAEVLIGIHF